MKIELRFRGLEPSEALRSHAARRIHFQLSRFNGQIASVSIRLSDTNGPKGGVDKHCRVVVRGPVLSQVTVDENGADPHAVLGAALERASHAVGRELERMRAVRHRGRARPAVKS